MKNSVGGVPCKRVNRILDADPRRFWPNTVSMTVFGVLSMLGSGFVTANAQNGPLDTADPLVLTRIAESASCTRYGINRMVELRVADDMQAPCEIAYLKPDEDQSTTSLWRAQNDYDYCAAKFSEFITKLENKLLWDCGASSASGVGETAEKPVMQDKNVVESALESDVETDIVTNVGVSEPGETIGEEVPRQSEVSALAPVEPVPQKQEPVLAAAVVTRQRIEVGPGAAVSMDDVRSRIPSGPYEAIALEGFDIAACPPGGSFFWNTRNPDQPVLEMGQDAEFTFSTSRGRVGEGFALQAEPDLFPESDDPSDYVVASLSVVGAGTLEARIRSAKGDGDSASKSDESVCQYSLGGG